MRYTTGALVENINNSLHLAIVFIILQIVFCNSFSWGIFSHVMNVDQYLMDYNDDYTTAFLLYDWLYFLWHILSVGCRSEAKSQPSVIV